MYGNMVNVGKCNMDAMGYNKDKHGSTIVYKPVAPLPYLHMLKLLLRFLILCEKSMTQKDFGVKLLFCILTDLKTYQGHFKTPYIPPEQKN